MAFSRVFLEKYLQNYRFRIKEFAKWHFTVVVALLTLILSAELFLMLVILAGVAGWEITVIHKIEYLWNEEYDFFDLKRNGKLLQVFLVQRWILSDPFRLLYLFSWIVAVAFLTNQPLIILYVMAIHLLCRLIEFTIFRLRKQLPHWILVWKTNGEILGLSFLFGWILMDNFPRFSLLISNHPWIWLILLGSYGLLQWGVLELLKNGVSELDWLLNVPFDLLKKVDVYLYKEAKLYGRDLGKNLFMLVAIGIGFSNPWGEEVILAFLIQGGLFLAWPMFMKKMVGEHIFLSRETFLLHPILSRNDRKHVLKKKFFYLIGYSAVVKGILLLIMALVGGTFIPWLYLSVFYLIVLASLLELSGLFVKHWFIQDVTFYLRFSAFPASLVLLGIGAYAWFAFVVILLSGLTFGHVYYFSQKFLDERRSV